MRVALCSFGELFGGVERQILDLCRYLSRNDLGPELVALFSEGELADRLRDKGFEPCIVSGWHRYDPAQVAQLRELLRKRSIDVLHVHGYKAAITAALACRNYGQPRPRVVTTEHGMIQGSRDRPIEWAKLRLNAWLERRLMHGVVDSVAYVTRDTAAHHQSRHSGLSRHVVLNGIDPLNAADHVRPVELDSRAFCVGIVGRITPIKGISTAIEALALPDVPDSVRVFVIGTGPYQTELRRLADLRGVSDRIEFLGFRSNVYDYLANLNAVLMPSYHEGLPYTLLEAMALGRPIVATRVGGLSEVIRNESTGILVPAGEAVPMAAALRRLVSEPRLAESLGFEACRYQRTHLTLEVMGRAYVDLYNDRAPSSTSLSPDRSHANDVV